MARSVAAIAVAWGAATFVAMAQPPVAPTRPPTFRADTRLVEVNVIVHDTSGQPVAGLTRDDFTLFDDGKEQVIDLFSVEGSPKHVSTVSAAPAPMALSGGIDVDNHLDPAVRGAATVILFDRVNTRIEDQRPARDLIVKFSDQIRLADRIALYSLEADSLRLLHDFTSDGASLQRALSHPVAGDRPPDDPELALWISRTTQAMQVQMQQERAGVTIEALIGVVRHLAAVRGRKNLIWVSSGLPLTVKGENISAVLGRAAQAIDDADLAIYPVDARGLVSGSGVAPAETAPPNTVMRGHVESAPDLPSRRVAHIAPNIDAMKVIAANTVGRAFFNTNDIMTAVRTALDDSRLTYVLGYYPSHRRWDGSFRPIAVKVNRPGLDMRHRAGYRAFPIDNIRAASANDHLLDAARSPSRATGLGLSVHASRATAAGADQEVNVTLAIHVEPGAMTLEKSATGWTISLGLAIAQSAADGRFFRSVVGNVDVDVPPARYDQILTQGFTFDRTVTLAGDADSVHVVLRDTPSDAIGSVIVPVTALRPISRP
ncbi:MAG: VWA domain-containing protein [Vicinamibacterales bacterium]